MGTYSNRVSTVKTDGEPIPRRELPDGGSEATNARDIESGRALGLAWASDPQAGKDPARLAARTLSNAADSTPTTFSATPAIDVATAALGSENLAPCDADGFWRIVFVAADHEPPPGRPCDMLSEIFCHEFVSAVLATVARQIAAAADKADGIRTANSHVDARVIEGARKRRRTVTKAVQNKERNDGKRRRRRRAAEKAGSSGEVVSGRVARAESGTAGTNGAGSEQLDLFGAA